MPWGQFQLVLWSTESHLIEMINNDFVITKKLKLDFIAESWKDAYIDFQGFTVADIKDKLQGFTKINPEDSKDVTTSLTAVIDLLKEKFIEGKAVNRKGELVSLAKEDIDKLPAEVISGALTFLSQGISPKTSVK